MKKALLFLWIFFLAGCTFPKGAEELLSKEYLEKSFYPEEGKGKEDKEEILPVMTEQPENTLTPIVTPVPTITLLDIPIYSGEKCVELNGNIPLFTEWGVYSYECYSELDELGRCGVAEACIGRELMPKEERSEIGFIKPSGWQTIRYDSALIEDIFLYNRCHLIAYQLTGENANEKNLITGTRFLNVEGMQPFENMIADYIERTGNHVMYRVTPLYNGDDLVATGVQMEGLSVEDEGEGICFHVFVYNVQPGILINYSTGESEIAPVRGMIQQYILNTNTRKFHYVNCDSVDDIKEKNKQEYSGERETLLERGYSPCKRCNP